MNRSLIVLFFILLTSLPSRDQTSDADHNISISSQKEEIEFVKGDRSHPVKVKHTIETNYFCNSYRTHFTVADLYNEQESIDNIDIYVNGERDKSIVPKTDYYSVSDIFYSDARMVYFELPLEKKGSVSKVIFEKTVKDPRYFTQVFFPDNFAIGQKEVRVTVPSWMNVELKEYNFEGQGIQKAIDRSDPDKTIYTYSARNIKGRAEEPESPGPTYVYPHLLFLTKGADLGDQKITYFSNTAEQYKWYHSLVLQIGNETSTVKTKADEITKGIRDDLDKVKSIYYWVQDNIRYIAFENGIAGFKPSPAQTVLQKKYGDCKGMANLTKELLVAAGFDARLCWIGTNHIAYDYSTPSLCVDNHMICALFFKGKLYFLDATEKNIGFNQYAERIQGRQVMVENGDQFILEHVPATTFLQNTEKETRQMKIEGTSLTGNAEHSYSGESKEGILSGIESIKKDKLEPALRSYLSEGSKDYQLSNLSINDTSRDEKPLELRYNFVHANAVSRFGNEIYIDLELRKELSTLKMDTTRRSQDYMLPYKMHLVAETILEIPQGYQPENLPAPFHFQHPFFEMNLSYNQANGKLVYRKEINFLQVKIPRKEFSKWNKAIDGLNNFYNAQLILTKQTP